MTVTEALAEIKTIQKRIEKKREFVVQFLVRQERLKDPLEKEGGSRGAIAAERQAIADLETRIVALRRGIAKANVETALTIGGRTMAIADWLAWRREIAQGAQAFLGRVQGQLAAVRREATQKGLAVVADEAQGPTDIIVNVNEKDLAAEIEGMEETLGTLDGLLSLKNATVPLDI